MPNGARSNSTIFSSAWCGAWSVAITSTRAVGDAFEHRVAIGGLAQRRVHLEVGVVLDRAVERLVGEREVMRRDLAGDLDAALLAGPHRAQRLPRAHVADVHVRAGQLGQRHVALDHQRFGHAGNAAQAERRGVEALVRHPVALERRILAVIDDRQAEHAGVLERAAHQQRRRHRPAIVRERDAAGGLLLAELGQLLAARARSTPPRSDRPGPGSLPRPS